MANRNAFLIGCLIFVSLFGIARSNDLIIPNPNNDDRTDFADFALFAKDWQKSANGLAGDFDDSNNVDIDDLMIFGWYWLTQYTEYQQCINADLNGDGIIAFEDLAVIAQYWFMAGVELAGDFDSSNFIDCNDLSVITDCWLKGTRPTQIWERFKAALAASDINLAVSCFADVSSENYRNFFGQAESYMPQMANDMGELIFVRQEEEIAYYDLLREENGTVYAYPVLFVLEETGEWKIYDF
jgi:hypothetical protein